MKDTELPDWLTRDQYNDLPDEDRILIGELVGVQRNSAGIVERLARLGMPIDVTGVLVVRIDCLLEQVFPNPVERAKFELHFESKVGEGLNQLESRINRAKLTGGSNGKR